MTSSETFEALMKGLGSEIGIPDPTPSETGVYSFECQNRFVAHVEADIEQGYIYLFSKIGDAFSGDSEKKDALNRALLQANLCGIGTLGCNLGVDPKTNEVMLSRLVYLEDLQLNQFLYEFEIFLEATNAWIQFFENGFPNLESSFEIDPISS